MDVDRALTIPASYDLRSRHHLSWEDTPHLRAWLDGKDVLYGAVMRLWDGRIVRRKELYETAFTLDRLDGELRRATALCELGAGHGLFGLFAALLHPHLRRVHLVDRRRPICYDRALEGLAAAHPFLKTRVAFTERRVVDLTRLPRAAYVVGVHCCGPLTDHAAALAQSGGLDFAVVPCCESRKLLPTGGDIKSPRDDSGAEIARLVNERRLATWRSWGYTVEEREIPPRVTGRTRLFVAQKP